jgi:hypothetical protein
MCRGPFHESRPVAQAERSAGEGPDGPHCARRATRGATLSCNGTSLSYVGATVTPGASLLPLKRRHLARPANVEPGFFALSARAIAQDARSRDMAESSLSALVRGAAVRYPAYALAAREKGMLQSLKACPACGKQAGELIEEKASRFPFRVTCGTCGWTTDAVKLEAVAVKLWNEAKREGKARARPK